MKMKESQNINKYVDLLREINKKQKKKKKTLSSVGWGMQIKVAIGVVGIIHKSLESRLKELEIRKSHGSQQRSNQFEYWVEFWIFDDMRYYSEPSEQQLQTD